MNEITAQEPKKLTPFVFEGRGLMEREKNLLDLRMEVDRPIGAGISICEVSVLEEAFVYFLGVDTEEEPRYPVPDDFDVLDLGRYRITIELLER